jgi:hypothetical protein
VNAIHVNCTGDIVRRRLKSTNLSVIDLVHDKNAQALLNARSEKRFVIYDEYGRDVKGLPGDHPTFLTLRSLHREGVEAKILKGGMREFEKLFPNLCTNKVTLMSG